MIIRITICSSLLLLAISLDRAPLFAEEWAVRPKPSRDKRLAPELDLVRHCDSHYMGMCRNGRSVYKTTYGQANQMKSMASSMDSNASSKVHSRGRRLLISYSGRGKKPSEATLKAAGLKKIEDYERGSYLVVEPLDSVTAQTVTALLADDAITHASPDYVMTVAPVARAAVAQDEPPTATTPNDPLFSQLWGMKNIGATQVWPTFRDATNVVVAVIDTGVDYTHQDLKANMWTKNGRYGYDFYDNDDDPMDEQNHGTHCAGTIAGVGNNGVGVVGVNWKARVMALRFLGPDGSGSTSDAVKCIDWAVANGAHVLSNSWAGPDLPPQLTEAIARAEQKGVLFVAAAGNTVGNGNNNDANPYYPASLPHANIISVGAIDVNNARGSFSHFGSKSVDIGAPGVGIVSTVRGNKYDEYDGTSMATPHVAGAAALVWAKTFASPAQDKTQMTTVRDLIYANARPVPALAARWGNNAPAKVPGGVLDISFLATQAPKEEPPVETPPSPPPRRLVQNRMKVDPAKLR
ncbi:MAG: S8 family peptidase [Planctomycetales bacterium]